MKVRACLRCKEYVLIKDGSFKNQQAVKLFERDHNGHVLASIDYTEVKDSYKSRTNEYMDKV
ncbi:MAG: hypothetical protein ACTSVI_14585 [Promethearchaeota archaeon]